MRTEMILTALEITWKGMTGLFATAALIWFCVWFMGKISRQNEGTVIK